MINFKIQISIKLYYIFCSELLLHIVTSANVKLFHDFVRIINLNSTTVYETNEGK